MKKLIAILVFSLLLSISFAGVDNMKQRQPGQAPVEQIEPDHHQNGHNHGGNPNVPIDYVPALMIIFLGIVIFGIYYISNEYKNPRH